MSQGGYRYGAFDDGPDPLADRTDSASTLDQLGDQILAGSNVRDALSELLRKGGAGMRGLQDLTRQVQRRRDALSKTARMDGMLERVRELLDRAVEAERTALFPNPSDDARLRESMLDQLPDSTAAAVRELAEYDWRSPQAREAYNELRELLQSELVDQQFRGLSDALRQPPDSASRQALNDMLEDLNQLLDKRNQGSDTPADFAEFMSKHGDFFPDQPQSLDELIDSLARQAATMSRMLASMTPEQRQELSELMDQAMNDLDLGAGMARLQDNLRGLRPDLGWDGRQRLRGEQSLGLGDTTELLADLADLDSLGQALSQDYPGASIDDIDEEAARRALGREAVDDIRTLRQLQRDLEADGYLIATGGRLELTPKAIRRLGLNALQRVFASLDDGPRGDHDVHRSGATGELTGSTRPWRFGDEAAWDTVATIRNALLRRGSTGPSVSLTPADIEVQETEHRSRAAVALLVDQSFSMLLNDTWQAAKTTALALHTLASTKFPADAIEIIAFANLARRIDPYELPDLEVSDVQGTNLAHALLLARRFLDRHRDAQPIVLVITDGEPTAHLLPDGDWYFDWPPSSETIAVTVAEVDRLTKCGVTASFFRLGDDPALARFLEELARRNGGRVLSPDGSRLGAYVVSDYVTSRRGGPRSHRRSA